MGLSGYVLNDPEGVLILAAGEGAERLADRIRAEAPPLSLITEISVEASQVSTLERPFVIAPSQGAGSQTRITPDASTCPDCLQELRDPNDRRHGYAFANCTNCGPRFTIITAMPYDRAKTTMAEFAMCRACAAEYADPEDRRFHAQPVACAECGPRVWLEVGQAEASAAPIAKAVTMLKAGKILAVKGLGGFHLVCDAANADSVARLRQRKRRPAKPLALMGTRNEIAKHCRVSSQEVALLTDPAAPIVLLEKQHDTLPNAVAPGQNCLGWMLPNTPLHHLLLDGFKGPLIMTSGNLSGEPQVIGNQEAREKLTPFVDGFVMHDRDIARRLDDSVERADPPMVLRRARGRVPGTLPLPPGFQDAPQVVAYGGQMKGALCLTKDGSALLGHHLGDLDDLLTLEAFEQADRDYAELFDHAPQIVAVDMHPNYRATIFGQARAETEGLRLEQVQHHHAHLASCLAENGWPLDGGKMAGIILDGTGLGDDGTLWGGEVLLGDYSGFERQSWLRPAPLIGGDMAARDPWRNALARLDQTGLSDWADELFANQPLAIARQAVERGINVPMSSSAGRLFDAVAACLGICPGGQSFEGEAAMRLEALAGRAIGKRRFGFEWANELPAAPKGELATDRLFLGLRRGMQAGEAPADLAYGFHIWLARVISLPARHLVHTGQAEGIAYSGGCLQNRLLALMLLEMNEDIPDMFHSKTPANDGGLALGQAVIAAARWVRAR